MTNVIIKSVLWLVVVAVGCVFVKSSFAADTRGFVFSGDQVVNARNKNEFARVSERVSIAELKRRFSRYKIRVAKGEDCLVCATISGAGGGLEIHFDEHATVITRILSDEKNSRDVFGNATGSSLRAAIGSAVAQCDAGMSLSCASSRLSGLSYIVADDEKCVISVEQTKKLSEIPLCARIAGFEIQ